MTIYGWDMSHYDAPGIGNAVAQGISFITHKVGGDANDQEIDEWWEGVRNLNQDYVLLGAYWVLYPGNPRTRAQSFISRLDATCPGWRDRPFILQVDCEKWNNNPATVPPRSDIESFCGRLVELAPKLRPIVYAPKWVYGDTLAGLSYPLWASSYVNGAGPFKALYPGDGSVRWGSYSGQVPAVLQYSSSATIAGQTTCDANAFRGTIEQLRALVAPGWEDDMPTAKDIAEELRPIIRQEVTGQVTGIAAAVARAIAGQHDDIARQVWEYLLKDPLVAGEMKAAGAYLSWADIKHRDTRQVTTDVGAELKDYIRTQVGIVLAAIAGPEDPPPAP